MKDISKLLMTGVFVLVVVILLFKVYAVMMPEAGRAGDSLNASNMCASAGCWYNSTTNICQANNTISGTCPNANSSVPLSSIFSSGGIIFIIVMVVILFVVLSQVMRKRDK